jgi:hypothetical protein
MFKTLPVLLIEQTKGKRERFHRLNVKVIFCQFNCTDKEKYEKYYTEWYFKTLLDLLILLKREIR